MIVVNKVEEKVSFMFLQKCSFTSFCTDLSSAKKMEGDFQRYFQNREIRANQSARPSTPCF